MSYAGNPDSPTTGFCPAPPPPPPPPPAPGQAPALRINTAEAPRPRRPPQNNTDPYEPPAAIQNAMMTKDKKPFTYTPGMGGKLDLSQIRSPRMARRVAKNANDEGIEGPPKSALEPRPAPSSTGGNIYVQPQVAVPVFPLSPPAQPTINRTPSVQVNRVPSNVSEPPRSGGRSEAKVTPITIVPNVSSAPQSPTSPPQVTLAKAPTPWLQNKPKQQEELPEWAKRANANKMVDGSGENSIYQQPQQNQAQSYINIQSTPSPQPQMVQRQPPIQQVVTSQPRQQERVVPLRVEDRPSVFSVMNEPGHHQFKQPPNQQQRWGQPQPQPQHQIQQQSNNQQSGGTRIIPIMVEDNGQSQARMVPVDLQGPRVVVQRGGPAPGPVNQGEPGPLQSRSFRVLQKITDTDADIDVDGNSEQLRKLQLTEDDKVLMNKFKEQVDGETYLHQEEDPRYRGAAIPSRAFRFLQNMTDSGEVPSTSNAPRTASAINKRQNRNSQSFEEAQANLPPSEQQVQEPRKYMGSAIPSRSFRLLQAMTSPENIAPQENHQQDFTSRTENSVTGNQQSGVFFPNCPSPYWNPENGWWGYYPVQYATQNSPNNVPAPMNVAYNPYAYCGYGDGNSFAYYPMYDQNYASNYAQNYNAQAQAQAQNQTLGQGEGQPNGEPSQQGQQVDAPSTYPVHGYLPMPIYSGDENYQQPNYHPYSNGAHDQQNSISSVQTEEEPKSEGNDADVPQVSNKNSIYLTVPKWTNQNRISVNSSKNNDDSRSASRSIEPVDGDRRNPCESAKRLVGSEKDSSGCTLSSKTDTDPTSESDSDSSDSDSDSSDSDSSDSSDSSSSSSSESDSEGEYHAFTNEAKLKPVQAIISIPDTPAKSQSDKDCLQSLSATTISEDGYEHSSRLSSDKLSCSDCDSDADDEYQIESLNNDCILPHQLSVIYEDAEHTETESESRKLECLKENFKEDAFEETGDPPDDSDNTTVSVSLPLRFKFSVSENNEDVTTVIVGDSMVKSGSRFESEERISRSCSEPDEANDVHVNFKIKKNENTSVDFTLRKQRSGSWDESFDTELTITEDQTRIDVRETSGESVDAKVTLPSIGRDENANFKMEMSDVEAEAKNLDWKENVETEFTIRRKKTDVTRHVWKKDLDLETEKELETIVNNDEPTEDTETEVTVKNKPQNSIENGFDAEYDVTTSTTAVEENVHKEIVEHKSLKIKERESSQTEFGVKKIKKVKNKPEIKRDEKIDVQVEVEDEPDDKNEPFDYTTVQNFNTAKRLLSVQNSRDETDDEDSGVTSDMSRIISEVDTDSECASIKRMNKYQRTQTHSRLFKLLNDDAILAEEDSSEDNFYSPGRREHLSLPLKPNVFNYDENYYSNYSSGITSPDYSPLCEQSWRRIHEGRSLESENSSSVTTPNECVDLISEGLNYGLFQSNEKPAPTDDPYFQTWKKVVSPVAFDYDILPSIAFKKLKKLESGIASYNQTKGNRINVLCPRIKSSKNVPQALSQLQSPHNKATAASSIPFLSTKSSLKNGHC